MKDSLPGGVSQYLYLLVKVRTTNKCVYHAVAIKSQYLYLLVKVRTK